MTADVSLEATIDRLVRDVPDFPEPGVVFKDITPLLADADALRAVVDGLVGAARGLGGDRGNDGGIDVVVGMEARGFLFGPAVALGLGCGFVPVRKPGKLPWRTRSVSYDLEYGSETLEIHEDALAEGARVLLVDDVLATGGTARAAADLVERAGAEVVGLAVLLELSFLPGRATLGDVPVAVLQTV